MNTLRLLLASSLVALGWALPVAAQHACSRCGCTRGVHKYCRLVCEEKEIKKTCYSTEVEDFCVPGRSIRCGEACDGCERYTLWQPTCARVRTRHKLVKREVVTRRPSWKWVVEDLCGDCCQELAREDLPMALQPERAGPPEASALHASHEATPPVPGKERRRLLPRWLLEP